MRLPKRSFSFAAPFLAAAIAAASTLITGCSKPVEVNCSVEKNGTHWNVTGECNSQCSYSSTGGVTCKDLSDEVDPGECKAYQTGDTFDVVGTNCACNFDLTADGRLTGKCL